ncbi:MAG: hypothetical protein PHQ43_08530 [Dehalococcoidales bacterium]|nr:hypothetical protein [Dehalococcoidales bacterium]
MTPPNQVTRDVTLRATVTPAQGIKTRDVAPIAGTIIQIIPHWPTGCNALVDIAFGHKNTWVMPAKTDTYMALDGATPILSCNEPVFLGEELWMVVRNRDAVNPHTVSVTVVIVGA